MKLKNVILMAALAMIPLTSCGEKYDDILDKIVATKTMYVATEATYSPFEYTNSSGDIVGFDVEIVKLVEAEIEKTYNIEIDTKWTNQGFDGLIGSIQTGKADLVAAAMSVTEERASKVAFSKTYFDTETTVITNKGTTINSMDELKAMKCGAQLGTVQADYITNEDETNTGWKSDNMVVSSVADLGLALSTNKIDAIVIETPVATTLLAKYTDMVQVDTIDFADESSFALATSKDDSSKFVTLLDKVITEATEDGTINKLYNQELEKAVATASN